MNSYKIISLKGVKSIILTHWPLYIALLILLVVIATIFLQTINKTGGVFAYALDDAYIHMAIAKNFSQHGVWGITSQEFSSTSSSLLWTLIISIIYFIIGVNDYTPLALNILISFSLIYFLYTNFRENKIINSYNFISLFAIIFIIPLPALIFTGMEHILHITISIVFVIYAAKIIETNNFEFNSALSIKLWVLGMFLAAVRYEGLFIVFVVCLLLIIKKQYRYSIYLGTISLIPLIIYGIISIMNGWHWLPNSLILKGNMPSIYTFSDLINKFHNVFDNLFGAVHILNIADFGEKQVLFLLLIASIILFLLINRMDSSLWKFNNVLMIIFTVSTIIHAMFADFGWFYRYEAYLIALGLYVNLTFLYEYFKDGKTNVSIKLSRSHIPNYLVVIFLLILAYPVYIQIFNGVTQPFAQRISISLLNTPKANYERYLEHVLPAKFIRDYTNNATIAINDIGAISYYNNNINILDLYGLGSREPLEFRKNIYDSNVVKEWARNENAKIAYIQIQWTEISPLIPEEWIKIAIWKIPHNIVFGDTQFAWYVIDKNKLEEIVYSLKIFSQFNLPEEMEYELYY